MPSVARLNVTPVKSTRLLHPDALRIEPYGAVGDRDFFTVDPDGRRFKAGRDGAMLRVATEHDREADELTFRFPDGSEVRGPAAGDGDPLIVDLWGRPVPCHLVGGPWAEALTAYTGRPTRLARTDEPGAGQDEEPVTLVSLASVREVARQGGRPSLDARRFRMTVELDGCAAHEEDTWEGRTLRLGGVELVVGGQVPRCVVTTLDPETGARDFPTLSVLSRYRNVPPRTSPPFGVYARVLTPGIVRVGDDVTVATDARVGA